jgi:hypothetical protein
VLLAIPKDERLRTEGEVPNQRPRPLRVEAGEVEAVQPELSFPLDRLRGARSRLNFPNSSRGPLARTLSCRGRFCGALQLA